jgi:hypothetical protein
MKKNKDKNPEDSTLYFLKIWQKISEVEGVKNVLVSDEEGKVLYTDTERKKAESLSQIISSGTNLALTLKENSGLGNFWGGYLEFFEDKLAWIYHEKKFWGLFLSEDALAEDKIDWESSLEKIKKIFSEKSAPGIKGKS